MVEEYFKREIRMAEKVGDSVGTKVYGEVIPLKNGEPLNIPGTCKPRPAYAMEYVDGKFPTDLKSFNKISPETYRETVDLYEKLLRHGYEQPEVQFFVDPKGNPRIIDFNVRPVSEAQSKTGKSIPELWKQILEDIRYNFRPFEKHTGRKIIDPTYKINAIQ